MAEPSVLTMPRLPARICGRDVSLLLGIPENGITVLTRHKHLTPLGRPTANSVKWFATQTIIALARDEKFLDKMTLCLERHWQERNQRGAQSRL
jgi:hypothetical protein